MKKEIKCLNKGGAGTQAARVKANQKRGTKGEAAMRNTKGDRVPKPAGKK